MEGKHSKLHHLDLAKKKWELEAVFDSIINKIPDLCMPVAYRLAGEEDYFNITKTIKLLPFRKQRDFDTCISPDLTSRKIVKPSSSDRVTCSTPESLNELKYDKKERSIESTQKESNRQIKVSFKSSDIKEKDANQSARFHLTASIRSRQVNTSMSKQSQDSRKKLLAREELLKKYTKIRIKKANLNEVDQDYRIGYDRLFRKRPNTDYPYANPITDCMLTDANIDNLREIIVSSINIEWKMLTPVRPHNEYEEKYFDKLIYLHRDRYKARLETNYFEINQQIPFKHTRHTILLKYNSKKRCRSPNLNVNSRLASGKQDYKLAIPTLTLTSDEKLSEPIESSNVENMATNNDSNLNIIEEDEFDTDEMYQEFNYENYSRFSRRNIQNFHRKNTESSTLNPLAYEEENELNFFKQEEMGILENDDVLEDQVENIINHLMNSNFSN